MLNSITIAAVLALALAAATSAVRTTHLQDTMATSVRSAPETSPKAVVPAER